MPYIQTNDIETYYEKTGTGPPLILIHGAVMDLNMWLPQIERLSEDYTVVAYDVRGHGRTGRSEKKPYSVELYVEDLEALISELDLEKPEPVLCGLSMGGCIAQVYAAKHPDKISGLVLADTFTPEINSLVGRLQMLFLRSTLLPVRLIGYQRVQNFMTWIQERFNKGASGDYEKIKKLQAEAPKIETKEFGKIIRSLISYRKVDIDYSAIDVPTLVMYGENEPGFMHKQARILEEKIPGVSIREIPDAGHASNIDNPGFFTDGVREILTQVYPSVSESDSELEDVSGESAETTA